MSEKKLGIFYEEGAMNSPRPKTPMGAEENKNHWGSFDFDKRTEEFLNVEQPKEVVTKELFIMVFY